MLAASHPSSQLMNLQGIWNEDLQSPWSSNLTVNINTEMNYWPAAVRNTAECGLPLVSLVEALRKAGAETAKKQFHCRGWVCNHNTDLWRKTGPVGWNPQWAYWPFGGVWLTLQAYEVYRCTLAPALLERLRPVLYGAARFYLDWLTEHKGLAPPPRLKIPF